MRKNGNGYELYLTDRKITDNDKGNEVTCTKYDTSRKEIITGTAKVKIKDGKNGKISCRRLWNLQKDRIKTW